MVVISTLARATAARVSLAAAGAVAGPVAGFVAGGLRPVGPRRTARSPTRRWRRPPATRSNAARTRFEGMAVLPTVVAEHAGDAGTRTSAQLHFCFSFAHVSFSDTARLNTSLPALRVRVHAEVAEPLELELRADRGIRQARLQLARARITSSDFGFRLTFQSCPSGTSSGSGLLNRWSYSRTSASTRVVGRDPVDRALHLAAVRGVAAAGGGVVGAVDLGHVAGGVLHDVGALDEVRVAQPHLAARGRGGSTSAAGLP